MRRPDVSRPLPETIAAPTAEGRPRTVSAAWTVVLVLWTAGAVVVVVLGMRLSLFNDDWYFLLQRPGSSPVAV